MKKSYYVLLEVNPNLKSKERIVKVIKEKGTALTSYRRFSKLFPTKKEAESFLKPYYIIKKVKIKK
jgi:hypothetical protein